MTYGAYGSLGIRGDEAETFIVEELSSGEAGTAQGPERALMSALLFDGVMNCLNYAGMRSKSCRARFKEALSWVNSRGSEYVFSFDNVCECLGINADSLRIGLINACNSRIGDQKKVRRNF